MGWVVNATPRPLYPRKRPGTHCRGDWVGPKAGLDGCGKSRLHRDLIPGPSNYTQHYGKETIISYAQNTTALTSDQCNFTWNTSFAGHMNGGRGGSAFHTANCQGQVHTPQSVSALLDVCRNIPHFLYVGAHDGWKQLQQPTDRRNQ